MALVALLRNYSLFYFGNFTEFDVVSEEHRELSRKLRYSGKLFKILVNIESVKIKVVDIFDTGNVTHKL